ncbi:MAG: YabP/YqfC family sporulation protein [Clostridia bacterium]
MENCNIILDNRENLKITGTKKVLSATGEQIVLICGNSKLCISGEKLEVKKIDVSLGNVEIFGVINCLKFSGVGDKVPFVKRIFK